MESFSSLLKDSRVIVVLGSGGVGKTTVSASLGVAAAKAGLKVLVLTIDPAKRLADALGGLNAAEEPSEIPTKYWAPDDPNPSGQLFAMMLDQKLTFDRLVDRFSPTPQQAEAVKKNQWYQQMSSALSGAQEYMAVSKLYEIVETNSYDLVVLDTPPTSNVLDFLEAPERLRNLLKLNKLRWFREKLEGSTAGKFLKWSSGSFFRLIGKITGQAVIEEILKLLDDLSIFAADFERHSQSVQTLLHSRECRYIQVMIPTHRTSLETLFLRNRLQRSGVNSPWLAINRMPLFVDLGEEWLHISDPKLDFRLEEIKIISRKISEYLEGCSIKTVTTTLEKIYSFYQMERINSENSVEEVRFILSEIGGDEPILFLPSIWVETTDFTTVERLSGLMWDSKFQSLAREVVSGHSNSLL